MVKHCFICNACIYFNANTDTELNIEKCMDCNGEWKEWQPKNAEFYEKDPQKFMECLLLCSQ